MQQLKFTEEINENAKMFFIIEEAKENILDVSKGAVRVL